MLKDDQQEQVSTVVGSSVSLTGSLRDTADIVVHGQVEGEVASEQNVIIGETARVKGPVIAQNVSVSGEVNGSVDAKEKLEIHPTGKVFGNITTSDLIIHSGAIFVGKSSMPNAEKEAKTEKEESKKEKKESEKESKEEKAEKNTEEIKSEKDFDFEIE